MAQSAATKRYSFDHHPEHREQLKLWADKWIANAMSTAPMTDEDRAVCREAVAGLYRAAGLEPPPRIVFVPSPLVLRLAGGFASAIWHARKTGFKPPATYDATRAATDDATYDATRAATRAATDAATYAATDDATDDATDAATRAATYAATYDATYDATDDATRAATRAATYDATRAATYAAKNSNIGDRWHTADLDAIVRLAAEIGVGKFGLMCAQNAFRMYQGGNQWSAWDSFISFFQDVAKLPLDYSKYQHWRTLAERSGPRIMHPEFCMISDRPEILTVDDQNRPHGENGPFCRWRDGFALYAWHGARIPARWIEQRESLDPNEVIKHENVELRAAGAAIVGWPKMLRVLDAKVIDDSGSPDIGQLLEVRLPGLTQAGRFLKAECPRNGTIVEGVPHVSDIDRKPIDTALAAQAWRVGLTATEYRHPEVRT